MLTVVENSDSFLNDCLCKNLGWVIVILVVGVIFPWFFSLTLHSMLSGADDPELLVRPEYVLLSAR